MEKNNLEIQKQAESFLNELFELLGVNAQVRSEALDEGEEKSLKIAISSSDNAGLLIGSHGSTLQALQSIVALSLRQKQNAWIPVSLDVDSWRERQDEYLIEMARQSAQRALETDQPQYLYNLSPSERRVIHMALVDEGVETASEGEGADRYLVIKPK